MDAEDEDPGALEIVESEGEEDDVEDISNKEGDGSVSDFASHSIKL